MMKIQPENVAFVKQLQNMVEREPDSIRTYVAKVALNNADYYPIKSWFNDLLSHGCICGMVGGLISYHDTRNFYDKHYFEIEDLRKNWEDSVSEPLVTRGDLKNFFAWFAFEETARVIANELGLD
ncbi:MAG: hypothetical protein GQ564_18725 [Bacteroidales bacterium]|nr:hypothetical protein [Bacteroidales bacterium]